MAAPRPDDRLVEMGGSVEAEPFALQNGLVIRTVEQPAARDVGPLRAPALGPRAFVGDSASRVVRTYVDRETLPSVRVPRVIDAAATDRGVLSVLVVE